MKKKIKLGETIKRRRKELGLSQWELAEMCFCDVRTIRYIENDVNYTTSEETLRLISAALYPDDPLRLTRIGKGISVYKNVETVISEAMCDGVFLELTTINQLPDKLGQLAVATILTMKEKALPNMKRIVFEPELLNAK